VPMYAQINYRFFDRIMSFFFPGRNIEREENLDDEAQSVPTQAISVTRWIRGAVNGSFRTRPQATSTSTVTHVGPGIESSAATEEIDKMKERAEKSNVFVYIVIPEVTFVVSYKGNKEKNIIDRFTVTFPACEYHDKNWTWLDLALALKQRCRKLVLQQFMAQKIIRIGKPISLQMDTVDEEETKRQIVLGLSRTSKTSDAKRK